MGGSTAYSIQQTPDSGYIVAGITDHDTLDLAVRNVRVSKLGKTGNIEWQKAYGGNNDDIAHSIALTSDGGYIIAGETFSTPLAPPFKSDITAFHGGKDAWIIKLSATGVKQWQRSWGGSGYEEFDEVQQTTDGGYVAIGYTTSHDGDVLNNINTNSSYWIVKLNSAGAIDWQKAIGGRYGRSIQQTTDGGYIVCGSAAATDSSVTGNHGSFDYWVVKLSPAGDISWEKSVGNSYTENGYGIRQTTDGGYVATGVRTAQNGDYFMWTVKLDTAGTTQWQKTLSVGNGQGESIEQTPDGGYIVAGKSSTDSSYHGGADFFVAKLDTAGNTQWKKMMGGSLNDFAHCVKNTYDGGYVVAGETISNNDGDVTGNDAGWDNMWVVKLASGNVLPLQLISFKAKPDHENIRLQWQTEREVNTDNFTIQRSYNGRNFTDIGRVKSSANSNSVKTYDYTDHSPVGKDNAVLYYRLEMADKDGTFTYSNIEAVKFQYFNTTAIHPNPAKDILYIQAANNIQGLQLIQVTDMLGKIVLEQKILMQQGTGSFSINISQLSKGDYLLVLKGTENNVVKFVKE